jgi:hypothetical protein
MADPRPPHPGCKCDRCESLKAGAPEDLEMLESCKGCGGRASIAPFCLTCLHEHFDEEIRLVRLSVDARSPWFGGDMLQLLKARKAQLPTGPDRMGFWVTRGGQMSR